MSSRPTYLELMTEHSMCQPGLPLPQGESQDSSSGFDTFQSAKSSGLRLRSSTSTRAPAFSCSVDWWDSFPYSANFDMS
ncbi:Uncharacterised protein [Candidatus Burarchaeum australiense]|nr:Uncharacterised protein [Candidatus Burarchaeum australiense]